MRIESFDGLLQAARAQAQPQRLLLVFTTAELPAEATPEQRQQFEAGQGGALTPLMCVDKSAEDLSSFQALLAESEALGPAWQVVFAAALQGSGGKAPTDAQVDTALQRMVDAIQRGQLAGFIPFDRTGLPLHMASFAS